MAKLLIMFHSIPNFGTMWPGFSAQTVRIIIENLNIILPPYCRLMFIELWHFNLVKCVYTKMPNSNEEGKRESAYVNKSTGQKSIHRQNCINCRARPMRSSPSLSLSLFSIWTPSNMNDSHTVFAHCHLTSSNVQFINYFVWVLNHLIELHPFFSEYCNGYYCVRMYAITK